MKKQRRNFFKDGKYYLLKGGKSSALLFSVIKYNLITLYFYFYDPLNITQVYWDNQYKMVQVAFVKKGKFQVNYPDGSYIFFYYEKA